MMVETRRYERVHGKTPRGYGNWAFGNADESKIYWVSGKYAEAKKEAMEQAKRDGIVTLYVLG